MLSDETTPTPPTLMSSVRTTNGGWPARTSSALARSTLRCCWRRSGPWPMKSTMVVAMLIDAVPALHGRDRRVVRGRDILRPGDGHREVLQQAVVQAVEETVHDQLLAALPSVLHDRRLADVERFARSH